MSLQRIIIGVSGGIAAYKSVELVRGFVKQGVDVRVVMTPAATDFVGPITFSTLSKNPVKTRFVDDGVWNDHVEMGSWADLLLIAPATANTLAKMVTGNCDNLLLAVYLSAKCPVAVAPAMDLDMYAHPTVKRNLATLNADGVFQVGPETGELASGLIGPGRMTEPEEMIDIILEKYN